MSTRDDLILPYNQAATKLAFHSNEISKDKLNNMKLVIYYWHPGACEATQILVHFYMLITLKHKSSWEVCEPVLCWKHSFIEWTYVVCAQCVPTTYVTEIKETYFEICLYQSMRQFQCVPTAYVTEIKETYFEIYTKQVSCPLAFLF